ncbi:hypothetical protein AB0F43_17270 [Kribbella sp. NPDC023972]|uniref:hypothetical protein n=1 Tax=Kribbella sp. NPDC023972 TaxID=3154795 RepID=UPI0033D18550
MTFEQWARTHLVVDGRPARLEGPAYLRVWYAGFNLQMSAEDAGLADPRRELFEIVDGMTLANPQNPASWLPVRVGL